MSDKLLEIKNLSAEYKTDDARVYAASGVNLSLGYGETLGLVGETGAGKTTTALSIMGLLPDKVGKITAGNIVLDGIDVTKASEADMRLLRGSTVSMIFQDPMSSLNPVIPVGKQIQEALELHNAEGQSAAELDAQVDSLLEMVGIPSRRKKEYPHQFSGGMKQRVVIAIALACKPKLILADEPTTALDVTIQAQVLSLIAELKEKMGTAMLLITHDLGVVAQTCDRVAVMYAGEIIESGTTADIFEGEAHHPYTQGLFGAIPSLTCDAERLIAIDGLMPDPTVVMKGCRFSPRCPQCTPQCRENIPDDIAVNGEHVIKCFLYGEAKKEAES